MNKLTKEQVKSYLDATAYIRYTHGIEVFYNVFIEENQLSELSSVETSPILYALQHKGRWIILNEDRLFLYEDNYPPDDFIESIDPRQLSAHGKLTMEAGLRG